jgi:HK97 family phage major capsid protein
MPSSSRKNAVWLINSDIEQQMFGMSMAIGTSGIPVWLPAGGASTEGYSTLFGRPVLPVEQCKTLGSLGDIVLADMSQYAVIERGGMEVAQSLHVRFEYHEQAIRFVHRIGGQPLWSAPLTPANGTLSQSPFVALSAR